MLRTFALALVLLFAATSGVHPALRARADGPEEVKLSLERYERLMQSAGRHVDFAVQWSDAALKIALPSAERTYVSVELAARLTVAGPGAVEIPLLPVGLTVDSVELEGKPATVATRGGLVFLVLEPAVRAGLLKLAYRVSPAADRSAAMIPLPALPGCKWEVSGAAAGEPVEVWPGTPGDAPFAGSMGPANAAVVRWGSDARGYYVRRADYELTPNKAGNGVDVALTLAVQLLASSAWVDIAAGAEALIEVTDETGPLHSRFAGTQQARVVGAGAHTIKATFRQQIARNQGLSEIALGLVRSSITKVQITVAGERTIQFDPAVPSTSETIGSGDAATTKASVQLPPTQGVVIRWTETLAPAEDKTRINCETIQLVQVDEGVLRSRVTMRYEVIRGQVRELAIEIPEGAVLYKVAGPGVEDWPMFAKDAATPRHTRIKLDQERQGRYELLLELEQRLPSGAAANVQIPLVRPLATPNLHRVTGVVALYDSEKVGFSDLVPGEGMVRLGEDAIPAEIKKTEAAKPSHVFKHIGAPGAMTAKVSTRAPAEDNTHINSETIQLIQVDEGVLRSRVVMRYEVIRGHVRELPIEMPEGAVLYKVAGPGVVDWPMFAKEGTIPRHTRIKLDKEHQGHYELVLELEQRLPTGTAPATIQVPLVRPLASANLHRQAGVVALYDGEKIAFSDVVAGEGMVRLGEDAIPVEIRKTESAKPGYVFKHVSAPGTLSAKVAEAKAREVIFDARIETLYSIKDGVINAQASALIDVKSGKTDHLIALLPTEAKPLTWTVPSVAKRPEEATGVQAPTGMTAYEVRFTRAFEGGIQLAVEFELRLPKDLGAVSLPALSILGAQLEQGTFGVTTDAGIKVTAGEDKSVRKIDTGLLPNSIRFQSQRDLQLGYSYVRAPWSLSVTVERGNLVETLDAVAEHAWYETTAFEDGNVRTVVTYKITNERQNHFRLTLPAGAKVLKLFLGDVSVNATSEGNTISFDQLPRGASFLVTVVYEVPSTAKLADLSDLAIPALTADIRVGDVQWLVRLPKKRWVAQVESPTMTKAEVKLYTPDSTPRPAVALYSSIANPDEYVSFLFRTEQVRADQPPPQVDVDFGLSWAFLAKVAAAVVAMALILVIGRGILRRSYEAATLVKKA